MAHEITHVVNRDVMVMTLASFFATLASMIMQFAFFFGGGYGRGNREQQEDIVIVMLVSVIVYAISLHAAAGAFALPRVRCRPRLGGADRAARARSPRR